MKTTLQRVGLFLGLLCFSLSALAANLTDAQVKNYIASIKAFEQIEADDADFDDWLDEDDFDFTDMQDGLPSIAKMLAKAPRDGNYKKAEAEVKKYGFSSLQQWAEVADRVNGAAVAAMLEQEGGNMESEMQRMQAEIQGMEGMSEEQKQMMLSLAGAGAEMMNNWTANVPEADIQVVKRHLNELGQVIDLE